MAKDNRHATHSVHAPPPMSVDGEIMGERRNHIRASIARQDIAHRAGHLPRHERMIHHLRLGPTIRRIQVPPVGRLHSDTLEIAVAESIVHTHHVATIIANRYSACLAIRSHMFVSMYANSFMKVALQHVMTHVRLLVLINHEQKWTTLFRHELRLDK